jgi:hypothetical protein
MPIPNDYHEIVNMLANKTDKGAVHWRSEKFDVSVVFDGARFAIWAGNDEHSEEPFVAFALQDSSGSTLDSWYVEEDEGSDYTLMHHLYKAAKRHAMGVPTKLKQLRDSLAAAEEVGDPKTAAGEA